MVEKKMQDKCQFKKAFLGIEGEKQGEKGKGSRNMMPMLETSAFEE